MPAPPRTSLAPNLLLALVSIGMTAMLFASLEGALYLLDLGGLDASRASRLRYQQVHPPLLAPARRSDGTAVLATTDPRVPVQSVLAEKPESSLRVFTFGGSATAGLGFSPNVTFARHLERLLESAHPERTVEVVNLGIVALSSAQVRVLVEDACRRYEPDAIVVYSGNNEFLEIHAEKYAASQSNLARRIGESLTRTRIYRLANRVLRGPPRKPSLAERRLSNEDLRVSQHAIIQHIQMTPDEIAGVVARYGENLDRIADIAADTGTPLVLMTVASNWRYRGREDLPDNWLDDVLGEAGPESAERYRAAIEILEEAIHGEDPLGRWEALYRRAAAEEALGDLAAARASYRTSMNLDPHLRRALDALADQVRRVGGRPDVHLFDSIEWLSQHAEAGIVGFDEFYDYVHFTPRGALRIGAQLFRELQRAGVTPRVAEPFADRYQRDELAQLASRAEDPLSRKEWMGVGLGDPRIPDRDLWKYDRMQKELDEHIVENPEDVRALTYRGNARAFELGSADAAERDYRAALAVDPDNLPVRRNLELLLAETAVPDH
jgi:tetratricopeptide (TPR) repeat protein